MLLRQLFDRHLAQYAYLVGCPASGEALVIDPERDVDRYHAAAEQEGLQLVGATETHIHADFVSGARELAEQGLRVWLSDEGPAAWKYAWAEDERYDVVLLKDRDTIRIGSVTLHALHTPGHTPEHLSFLIADHGVDDSPMALFSGDFVFVGDLGRPDLLEAAAGEAGAQEPSARQLFASARRFLEMPEHVAVWPGHGAGSACGKALGSVPCTTVGYETRHSAPLLDAAEGDEGAFVDRILQGQPEPPLYFARMKKVNKEGPNVLGSLPQPQRLSADELARRDGATILDARPDREAFLRGHLPGALHVPMGRSFPTVAGSYADPDAPVLLVCEEDDVELAVRLLVRVGLDQIEGFCTPNDLEGFDGLASLPSVSFDEVEARRAEDDVAVLDVRGADEYDAGHVPGALRAVHTRLPKHLSELPTDQTLYVHCQRGARAAIATALLAREGFDVVHVDDAFPRYADEVAPDEVVRED